MGAKSGGLRRVVEFGAWLVCCTSGGWLQMVLLVVALVAIPWMLLPKPLILRRQHVQKMQGRTYGVLEGSNTESTDLEVDGKHEEEVFEFGEVLVHQMIHNIEFVLGAMSNTASYLSLVPLATKLTSVLLLLSGQACNFVI